MDKETFCTEYCPMPFRGKFRNGDDEVDCDCDEDTECPFRNVDFSKVDKYENNKVVYNPVTNNFYPVQQLSSSKEKVEGLWERGTNC